MFLLFLKMDFEKNFFTHNALVLCVLQYIVLIVLIVLIVFGAKKPSRTKGLKHLTITKMVLTITKMVLTITKMVLTITFLVL